MTRPFMKAGFIGVLVIIMSIVLMGVFPSKAPSLPEGFFTPIIAFEFAHTQEEVIAMFGGPESGTRQAMTSAMDLGNRLDYLYMCLYSLFLLTFCAIAAKLSGKKYVYAGVLIALVALLADAFENIQLLSITAKLPDGDFSRELMLLQVFTWIKWGGIVAVFWVLIPWFMKGKIFSKIIGVAGITSGLLAVAAYLHRSVINEIFCLTVAVMFLLMIIYCFAFKTDETA